MHIVKNVLIGLLAFIGVTILEFLVTLPLGEPSTETLAKFVNRELLLTALPAGLVTFLLAWVFRTKSKTEALERSIVWTVVLALWYLVIAIGNDNFKNVFGQIGIYILLICSFSGPLVFSMVKKLE